MERLPEDPRRYFKMTFDTEMIPLSKLRPEHKRPSGIERARTAMRLAYDGKIGRRDPITVAKTTQGNYSIVDGNSTFAIAKENGWKKLPVIVRRGFSVAEQLSEALVPSTPVHNNLSPTNFPKL